MNRFGPSLVPPILLAFILLGCHGNHNQSQPVSSSDPAAANLAPASSTTAAENPPPLPPDQGSQQTSSAPPPGQESVGQTPGDQDTQDQEYGDTAEDVAPQPPPPIPDYDQPPAPDDDYEWTPGYWAYASDGYYWVPGEWVLAPWVGALWTPGYWSFAHGQYDWHHGYWGPHVGFYGGVNYGYGYDGDGYEGGYWRGRHFYYNSDVTHVDRNRVHQTYAYRVSPHNSSRVSYNGGHGGLAYRPSLQQQAADRERHTGPLSCQRGTAYNAQQDNRQFYRNNHGQPQTVAEAAPQNGGRTAPAARPEDFRQPQRPIQHQPARTSPLPFNRRQPSQPGDNHGPTVARPDQQPNTGYQPRNGQESSREDHPQPPSGTNNNRPGAEQGRQSEPRRGEQPRQDRRPQQTPPQDHPQGRPDNNNPH